MSFASFILFGEDIFVLILMESPDIAIREIALAWNNKGVEATP